MPEFLQGAFAAPAPGKPTDVLLRLVAAAILGFAVAGVYRATRERGEVSPTFPGTLVLLSVLIAMVTQVIGDNVARAFSLVGALSIVRFRTVVRDTQDTAFVIFAVVVGMAAGAADLVVAGIGLAVVGIAAFVMRPRRDLISTQAAFVVNLRVGLGHDIETLVGTTLDASFADRHLVSLSTARQGLSVDVCYRGTLRGGSTAESLVKALNRIEGVQSVELARQAAAED